MAVPWAGFSIPNPGTNRRPTTYQLALVCSGVGHRLHAPAALAPEHRQPRGTPGAREGRDKGRRPCATDVASRVMLEITGCCPKLKSLSSPGFDPSHCSDGVDMAGTRVDVRGCRTRFSDWATPKGVTKAGKATRRSNESGPREFPVARARSRPGGSPASANLKGVQDETTTATGLADGPDTVGGAARAGGCLRDPDPDHSLQRHRLARLSEPLFRRARDADDRFLGRHPHH